MNIRFFASLRMTWKRKMNFARASISGREEPMISKGGVAVLVVLTHFFLVSGVWAQQDLLDQAMAAFKAHQYAQAEKLLGTYLQDHPQAVEARRHRALALSRLERPQEALTEVEAGLQHHPKEVSLLLVKGSILGELTRREEAIQVFTQVLQQDPKNGEALKERGNNFANEGRLEEAMRDLNQAAQLLPQDPWVFNHRGMVYFCQNDFKAAVADFSAAITLRPDLPHAYFFRGNLYRYHLNQPDKALADFKEGCRLGHPLCCQELEKSQTK
ncbi:MAG: tetratricopeptide repeat protein [Deltaproteobacteria bacterium]|nr:tetratricopeptide repeat protein [Deltaproteobacteria bacterium]